MWYDEHYKQKCINCNLKIPYFNYTHEKTLYCVKCKLENMIDIKSKRCITCNIKLPVFNYPNEKQVLYCNDCKKCGMVNTKNKKCIHCNLTRADKHIIITVLFVLLTYFQMIPKQPKQDVQNN